jgi:hypothetical protein
MKRTEDDLLDIGDMAGAPSTQMFPRGCRKLNMPAGGIGGPAAELEIHAKEQI